jgi:hypothetical protein
VQEDIYLTISDSLYLEILKFKKPQLPIGLTAFLIAFVTQQVLSLLF